MFFYKRNRRLEKETWHLWFAWYPVRVEITPDGDGRFLFLETVKRCGEFTFDTDGGYWTYQYRSLLEREE